MNTRLLNSQPWRFKIGALVYVRGWPAGETARVVAYVTELPFPHYLVMDSVGMEWQVCQLELSRRPLLQE